MVLNIQCETCDTAVDELLSTVGRRPSAVSLMRLFDHEDVLITICTLKNNKSPDKWMGLLSSSLKWQEIRQ